MLLKQPKQSSGMALMRARIIALAKLENTASRRVIEKIGMRYTKNAEYWGMTCAYDEISKTEHIRMLARNKRS